MNMGAGALTTPGGARLILAASAWDLLGEILPFLMGFSFFYFFFSSRRRHTIWPRDWSSDVCSSDLGEIFEGKRKMTREARPAPSNVPQPSPFPPARLTGHFSFSFKNFSTCKRPRLSLSQMSDRKSVV